MRGSGPIADLNRAWNTSPYKSPYKSPYSPTLIFRANNRSETRPVQREPGNSDSITPIRLRYLGYLSRLENICPLIHAGVREKLIWFSMIVAK